MGKKKIVISDTVLVKVEGQTTDDEGKPQPFGFSLTCKRMSAEDLGKVMASESSLQTAVKSVATGWSGQSLVVEEDGTPSPFDEEGIDALLSIPSMALLCFNAFHKATGATAKN